MLNVLNVEHIFSGGYRTYWTRRISIEHWAHHSTRPSAFQGDWKFVSEYVHMYSMYACVCMYVCMYILGNV